MQKLIGKRVSITGKFLGWGTGMSGVYDEKTQTQIIFEALPVPQKQELILKYTVTRYREKPNDFAMSVVSSGGSWHSEKESPIREERLRDLLKPFQKHETITATGKLCHLKVISSGDYDLFPQIPSSHFFFSVDDLEVKSIQKSGD